MPKLKDFHMDPEYRKYVFAEEYLDSGDASGEAGPHGRDLYRRRQEHREASAGLRRRVQQDHGEAKIGENSSNDLGLW